MALLLLGLRLLLLLVLGGSLGLGLVFFFLRLYRLGGGLFLGSHFYNFGLALLYYLRSHKLSGYGLPIDVGNFQSLLLLSVRSLLFYSGGPHVSVGIVYGFNGVGRHYVLRFSAVADPFYHQYRFSSRVFHRDKII